MFEDVARLKIDGVDFHGGVSEERARLKLT
jgi:hypothetical protein